MVNDENTELLLGLGLTLNQAKVYLAVLKLEKTTVGQVAKFSKVRREDVYRILPALPEEQNCSTKRTALASLSLV
jgi:sugar-specific transcriptional regulator TrmB